MNNLILCHRNVFKYVPCTGLNNEQGIFYKLLNLHICVIFKLSIRILLQNPILGMLLPAYSLSCLRRYIRVFNFVTSG
jgi:hypothetical protein